MRLPVPGPLRMMVGLAADALGKLDSALSADRTPRAPEASPDAPAECDVAEMLLVVRDAQRVALERRDAGLARRLSALALHLSQEPAEPRPDALFPTRFARASADDRIKDLRQQLLANTPRPDQHPADGED